MDALTYSGGDRGNGVGSGGLGEWRQGMGGDRDGGCEGGGDGVSGGEVVDMALKCWLQERSH